MTGSRRPRRAFTMVEMLVVIGIIAVLAGMLLPAISTATRRAKKVEETNRIRQVGIAWNLYANGNDDAALPGYLEDGGGAGDENVQEAWNVHYKLPDKEPVLYEDAAPWPWRVMPYLDYDHEVMLGYLELEETSELIMADYTRLDPDGMHRPTKIARHPAFGYNAYYTGGWWEMMSIDGRMVSRPRFNNAHTVGDDGTPTDTLAGVVAFSPSSIRNTTDYVIFCSSPRFPSGATRARPPSCTRISTPPRRRRAR
jgi:prepilin-type N-terminal cleavage/methylation domain-containing protein